MAGWKNASFGLALFLILLGVCCDANDEGVAGEESQAHQGIIYPPWPQFPPRPLPPRIPFYPPPRLPPRRFPAPPPRQPPAPPRRAAPFDITTFVTFYYLLRALATTAAPTTTPAPKVIPVCVGSWGEWGACSAKCAGTQSRKHSCTGAMEYRPCNGPGVQGNGWYRASNCYEYLLSSVTASPKANAVTACGNLGSATLAQVGMRNTTVRTEIHQALFNSIQQTIRFYIGLELVGGTWTWDDGSTDPPNLWDIGQPSGTLPTPPVCARMTLGNPQSGDDFNCGDANYLCERKIT